MLTTVTHGQRFWPPLFIQAPLSLSYKGKDTLNMYISMTKPVNHRSHFETNAPNDYQMTLNSTRPQAQYPTNVLLVSQSSQISVPFCFTASRFRITVHVETSALNDSKTIDQSESQRYPDILVTGADLELRISACFALRPPALGLLAILKQVC